jgi:hypothetical protein
MTAHLPAKKADLRPDFTRRDEILTALKPTGTLRGRRLEN